MKHTIFIVVLFAFHASPSLGMRSKPSLYHSMLTLDQHDKDPFFAIQTLQKQRTQNRMRKQTQKDLQPFIEWYRKKQRMKQIQHSLATYHPYKKTKQRYRREQQKYEGTHQYFQMDIKQYKMAINHSEMVLQQREMIEQPSFISNQQCNKRERQALMICQQLVQRCKKDKQQLNMASLHYEQSKHSFMIAFYEYKQDRQLYKKKQQELLEHYYPVAEKSVAPEIEKEQEVIIIIASEEEQRTMALQNRQTGRFNG